MPTHASARNNGEKLTTPKQLRALSGLKQLYQTELICLNIQPGLLLVLKIVLHHNYDFIIHNSIFQLCRNKNKKALKTQQLQLQNDNSTCLKMRRSNDINNDAPCASAASARAESRKNNGNHDYYTFPLPERRASELSGPLVDRFFDITFNQRPRSKPALVYVVCAEDACLCLDVCL